MDPNIGGIGHLLVATDPVVRLPQGNIQLASNPWPEIYDRYLADEVFSFSLRDVIRYGTTTIPSWIMATTGKMEVEPSKIASEYDHDFETVTPYYSELLLEDYDINVEYTVTDAVSYYKFTFPENADSHILLGSNSKFRIVDDTTVEGEEAQGNRTHYFYAKFSKPFKSFGAWKDKEIFPGSNSQSGDNKGALVNNSTIPANGLPYAQSRWSNNVGVFANYATQKDEQIEVKISVSSESMENAKQIMEKEIPEWNFAAIKDNAKNKWTESLDLFKVEGGTESQRTIFYTGIYFSRGGEHLLNRMNLREKELVERAKKYTTLTRSDLYPATSTQGGMFQHTNIVFITSLYLRGIRDFDIEKAYENMKIEFLESTKLPWRKGPATVLDKFYLENGFFPAKPLNKEEWVPEVHPHELRQSVTVTLQAAYESWCIAQIAKALGKTDDYNYFIKHAHDYQNVFNTQTNFVAPKTEDGQWIVPFNPTISGRQGGRDYFAELNSWIYTWYITHDIQGLINLMGGRDKFTSKLDSLFVEQYQTSKYHFLSQFPDQTGLIGNYAHGNEFSRQIPYLYNYSGAPWKTQKRVREIMEVLYTAGPLGICGDEDTGLMSHWYICSAMGIYADPMIPNYPVWQIGSPIFKKSTINLGDNKTFVIEAKNVSAQNKYVQSASLNGEPLNKPWFEHSDLVKGGTLVLNMGPRPNKQWGSSPDAIPPSMSKPE
ncbi:alpha-1 2-mannosidase [Bacteroidia bacterium]|nr:alpha-1 2-mannosidase [Bacteroidia bacterium]